MLLATAAAKLAETVTLVTVALKLVVTLAPITVTTVAPTPALAMMSTTTMIATTTMMEMMNGSMMKQVIHGHTLALSPNAGNKTRMTSMNGTTSAKMIMIIESLVTDFNGGFAHRIFYD